MMDKESKILSWIVIFILATGALMLSSCESYRHLYTAQQQFTLDSLKAANTRYDRINTDYYYNGWNNSGYWHWNQPWSYNRQPIIINRPQRRYVAPRPTTRVRTRGSVRGQTNIKRNPVYRGNRSNGRINKAPRGLSNSNKNRQQ